MQQQHSWEECQHRRGIEKPHKRASFDIFFKFSLMMTEQI
jgi:hypothetical protein